MFGSHEEMSDDEVVALVVSLVLTVIGGASWYLRGVRTSTLGATRRGLPLLLLTPLAALALLWIVLALCAAVEVRTDVRYQFLFVAMGGTWVFLLPRMLALIGVSYRDDALERRNDAAAIAITGAIVGLASLFGGSNVGEGASIWNTVATALAATVVLFALLIAFASSTSLGESIAIERDRPTGVRFAGWVTAVGLVLGRAAAGDWESTAAMLRDLVAVGWPVVALTVVAIAIEHAARPRADHPEPSMVGAGVVPAVTYVALSCAYVAGITFWPSGR